MTWILALAACRPGPSGEAVDSPADTSVDTSADTSVDTSAPFVADRSDPFQGFVPTNIVVVHSDTLRYDHTPWYGHDRNTFPNLTARTGWVRWERMYASSGWTAPSTTSVLTGLDVHHHGVRMVNEEYHDELVRPTFAQGYAEQGFATAFITGNELFAMPGGLTAGFDNVELIETEPVNSQANFQASLDWLDRLVPGTPFVLHVQAFDPHQPWRPSREDLGTWSDPDNLPFEIQERREIQQAALAAALRSGDATRIASTKQAILDLYDEELLGLDRSIEALLVGLEERGRLADTLVVFTADHGETLFDRGDAYGHGTTLYEELVRVPMLFYNPALVDASIDGCLGSAMDLHPTLLSAMGLPIPAGLDGRPLQGECRPLVTATIHRETADDDETVNLVQMTALTVDHKLLRACAGQTTGYDLAADPGSVAPLASLDGAPFPLLAEALDALLAETALTWPEAACPSRP